MESVIGMRSGPAPLPHLDTAFCISCFTLRILVVIRRQARVIASHSEPGPSTSRENQLHQIQTNVIKTMVIVSAFFVITWASSLCFSTSRWAAECICMVTMSHFSWIFSTSPPTYLPTPLRLIKWSASWCVWFPGIIVHSHLQILMVHQVPHICCLSGILEAHEGT